MFQGVNDLGVARVLLTVTERYAFEQTAQPSCVSEVGTYVFHNANGDAIDNGKYLVLWSNGGEGVGYKYM